MDWLLAAPQIHSTFSSLGSLQGDTYTINRNALAILEEINYKLTYEDQTLRTFRRAIGFGQNVRSDLIPLLENAKDFAILDVVIRILVNLTVPVECLFSVDVMYRTEVGRHTIYELNKLLYTSKEAFTDPKSTKSVVEYMKVILESDTKLTLQKCDQINNCLLLLRNILHIPETNTNFIVPTAHSNSIGANAVSMQNSILWNLFIQSIDKLLLYLMTCPQRAVWGVTMVQLIAVMYKDQHVSTLQKLLSLWFEASISESSEDNESNTSPPKQGSGDSSPMLTSDPTSDSSDNGGNSKNNSSEDRRQALREETEATLQEVSRKGQEYQDQQEYQNSKLFVSKLENSSGSNSMFDDFEEPCTSAQAAPVKGKIENCQRDEKKDQIFPEANEIMEESHEVENTKQIHSKNPKRKVKHPANKSTHTSNMKINKNKADKESSSSSDVFMPPPPAVRGKASVLAQIANMKPVLPDSPPKPHQKVPHAGQLSMAKGKSCPQKRECPSSQSEMSDCGYATQVENQESISTSSNDDDGPQGKPQHQKPPCNTKARAKPRTIISLVDKKELRRKKLVRRGKSSLINMKGLVQHAPSDEDISNLLKEFTVDFLLKGYGHLVEDLHKQLLIDIKIPIDTSHFFWLITYFLKFAAQLELDMEHINSILTYDIISYLTYEGVTLTEQLELNSRQEGSDLKPYLRRLHLVVTAIREFLQAIETYKKVSHLSEDDRENLRKLFVQVSLTEDLRCLFVLLLRSYNPALHTKQYLQDLIVTNHILLIILDSVTKSDDTVNVEMLNHISQFATVEMMHHYGMLLEDFNNNGEFVNDCIFTMMHHVAGDLGHISTLFQPVILRAYSRIWEADYELCDDWSDLIEYVIHKFMNTPQKSPLTLPPTSLTELTKEHNLENSVCTWSQEEMDTLYWYYVQSKKDTDIVGKILNRFSSNGNKHKSRISIINQLLQQDIITLVEYDDLMKFEDAEYQRSLLTTPTSCTTESGIEMKSSSGFSKPSDDIQILRDFIIKDNKGKHLIWLQKLLLECCYVKLILRKTPLHEDHRNLKYMMEPVAYHAIYKNKSIPVVQWNQEQVTTMLYQPFVLLLHKLGFQLPADAGSIYARIPDYWTAETMFGLVKKLGPIKNLFAKFDTTDFDDTSSSGYHSSGPRNSLSSLSSFETDINESDHAATASSNTTILSPVAEMDSQPEKLNEIFAIPKPKHCNSIIRYTPDPSPMSTMPNWLQLVMRSKCYTANTIITTTAGTSLATSQVTTTTTTTTSITNQRTEAYANNNLSDDQMILSTTEMETATDASEMPQDLTASKVTAIATTAATVATPNLMQEEQTTSLPSLELNNIIGLNGERTTAAAATSNNNCDNSNNANATDDSKAQSNDFHGNEVTPTATITTIPPPSSPLAAIEEEEEEVAAISNKVHTNVSDGDCAMEKMENHDSCYLLRTRCSATLESEFIAMVAAAYENETAKSDTHSVASDLTRMYVSDEDDH